MAVNTHSIAKMHSVDSRTISIRPVFVKDRCPRCRRQQSQNRQKHSKYYILTPAHSRGMWCQWSVWLFMWNNDSSSYIHQNVSVKCACLCWNNFKQNTRVVKAFTLWTRRLSYKGLICYLFSPRPSSSPGWIWSKNTTLVRDHEYCISTKFHKNPSSGSGEGVENVNCWQKTLSTNDGRTTGGRLTMRDHSNLWPRCTKILV